MGIISREWEGMGTTVVIPAHSSTSLIVTDHAQSVTKVELQMQSAPHVASVTVRIWRFRNSVRHRPFSSDRQYLNCDGCLEVRGEIIRTVLCCIVYWSCAQSWAHLDEQFLQFSELGFVIVGRLISLCIDALVFTYVILCFFLSTAYML